MTIFFAIVNVLVVVIVAYQVKRIVASSLNAYYWPALIVKITAGICFGLVYLHYYQGIGDTLLYFRDASVIADLARTDPAAYLGYLWNGSASMELSSDIAAQPRTLFMLKLASVFNLLTHDNYWITTIYFSFISFLATWYLASRIVLIAPSAHWPVVVGFLFFPSVVFWTSGLIKETLAMAAIYILSACYLKAWFSLRLKLWEWVLIPVSVWIVWSLKYYFLAVMAPVGLASLGVHKIIAAGFRNRQLSLKIVLWLVSLVLPLMLVAWLHPNFYPDVFLQVIVSNYDAFHALSAPEDLIFYTDFRPTAGSILRNAPLAMFSGLFRPLLWEAGTLLQVVAALENMFVLLLCVGALRNVNCFVRSPYRLLLATVLLYALVLAAFLALSTPNFGTLSRYRVGFLSFLVCVLCIDNPFINSALQVAQRYFGRLAR